MNYGNTFDPTKTLLSYSSLKAFRRSPLHFMEYKFGKKKAPSDAMKLGVALENLVLPGMKFDDNVAILPEGINRRSKAGKEEYEAFLTASEKKIVITNAQFEKAKEMSDMIKSHTQAREWLDCITKTQIDVKWKHKETDLKVISKIDFEGSHPERGHFIGELKTASDASTDKFIRDAHNFEYHLQAGSYLEAYKRKFYKFPMFIYIVVESSAPFAVNVLFAEDKFTEHGANEFIGTLKIFRYCVDEKKFDRHYEFEAFDGENVMRLPGYYKSKYGAF